MKINYGFHMQEDHDKYSSVVCELKSQFNHFKERGYASLFICANPWGIRPLIYVPVPDKVWPWAVLDNDPAVNFMGCSSPIIAFDLKGAFDAQMPEHLRQIEIFDCFAYAPLIHIPDRQGIVPAKKREEFTEKALKQRPSHLRLVK